MSEESTQYTPTTLEVALRDWVVQALTVRGLEDGVAVAYGNQGKVRPQKPLVTVTVLTDSEVETMREVLTGNQLTDGSWEVCQIESRGGTVQVMCFGLTSWTLAKAIAASMRNADIVSFNASNNPELKLQIQRELVPITNLPNPLSITTEQRRYQDFEFAYSEATILPDGRGVLERAIVSGDVYIDTPGDGVDVDVDESWPAP